MTAAGRQGRDTVNQDDVFSALERLHRERSAKGGALGGITSAGAFEEQEIPPLMRRTIAVYEAAKALTGYITPNYDEITKVQHKGCCSSSVGHCTTHHERSRLTRQHHWQARRFRLKPCLA